MTYKLTRSGVILNDIILIPADPDNRDWQEYQEWLTAGNTPLPADPEPDPAVEAAKAKLQEIDRKSIRDIREWIAKQADAPSMLKALEAQAIAERAKVKT